MSEWSLSFSGMSTSNFTASNDLFLSNSLVQFWRFEVVYSVGKDIGSSGLNFAVNQPPANGSCWISPLTGATSTVFTVSCPGWLDTDGVKDYSLYSTASLPLLYLSMHFLIVGWSSDLSSSLVMIAYSPQPYFDVRLPASLLHLVVHVRDTLEGVTVLNLTSVTVTADATGISDLITAVQNSSASALAQNPLVQLLNSCNQNTVAQTVSALAQYLNTLNTDSVQTAISSQCTYLSFRSMSCFASICPCLDGLSATSISVSSLDASRLAEVTFAI